MPSFQIYLDAETTQKLASLASLRSVSPSMLAAYALRELLEEDEGEAALLAIDLTPLPRGPKPGTRSESTEERLERQRRAEEARQKAHNEAVARKAAERERERRQKYGPTLVERATEILREGPLTFDALAKRLGLNVLARAQFQKSRHPFKIAGGLWSLPEEPTTGSPLPPAAAE